MFKIGQRWFSEGEPELGLGMVTTVEDKQIVIDYPLVQEQRRYGIKSSPLKRFTLDDNEKIKDIDGNEYIIARSVEEAGLRFYLTTTDDKIIPEMDIHPKIDLQGPLPRIFSGNFDHQNFYQLRYQSYLALREYQTFKHRGLLGPRVRLIPHQIYIANQILEMTSPKVMLCDEVGLGKTIEACLVLHALIQRELVTRTIIIVPESLVNQWFVELYKKFNLSFQTIKDKDDLEDIEMDQAQQIIVSTKELRNNHDLRDMIEAQSWDALIVDESHQINFEEYTPQTDLIKKINKKTYTSLFLSATPEVLGKKNLFSQLEVLDSQKYNNYEKFVEQFERAQVISDIVKEILETNKIPEKVHDYFSEDEFKSLSTPDKVIKALIDRFGTGRNYFRNSRQNLERFQRLFNDRLLFNYPLENDGKLNDKKVLIAKTEALHKIIDNHKDQKILVLCHSKKVVMEVNKILLERENLKISLFHSEQSVLERDRQAAYFANPDGAQILLSTEIGSEGRNFEFASHLVLFDLPKLPDQLEQRIGRLDRIGQKNDIHIHVLYMRQTFEESLFRWYNEVFESFTTSPKAAGEFYKNHHDSLVKILQKSFNEEELQEFLKTKRKEYTSFRSELEKGRDVLIEAQSYNNDKARAIIQEIQAFEEKSPPINFLEQITTHLGINYEELNDITYFLQPSENMLIPSYAHLPAEGKSISYDRENALKFDNIEFCTWEHPLVKTAFDIILNSPLGNATVIQVSDLPRDIYFEFIVTLQCSDQYKYLSQKYLPYTPLRCLLNTKGEDKTKKISKKFLDSIAHNELENEVKELIHQLPKDIIKAHSDLAKKFISSRIIKLQQKAIEDYKKVADYEKERVKNLNISAQQKKDEMLRLEEQEQKILNSIKEATIALDGLRIIIPN